MEKSVHQVNQEKDSAKKLDSRLLILGGTFVEIFDLSIEFCD